MKIKINSHYKCNKCGYEIILKGVDLSGICHNCGSMMEKQESEIIEV